MQTFLAYPNFWESLECLDYRREGNQRIEASAILKINEQGPEITYKLSESFIRRKAKPERELLWGKPLNCGDGVTNTPYYNHPAAKMWRGYEGALKQYYNIAIIIWREKGFINNMKLEVLPDHIEYPHWLGDEKLHASHRSNLLRKDSTFYSQYGWKEPNNLPYYWPEK